MKKIISVLLSAIILFSIFAISASAENVTSGICGENMTWSYDETTNTLTIFGTGDMTDYSYENAAPWKEFYFLETVFVSSGIKSIGDYAFQDLSCLKEVHLPDGLEKIGEFAFNYSYNLTKINIPDTVIFIGDAAFMDCQSLESIIIPEGVTVINESVFSYSHLENISLPESLTGIKKGAFSYCDLKTITIPASVTNIYEYAFSGCYSLEKIIVDSSNRFYSSDENGALYDKNKTTLIIYPINNKQTEYNIPLGVKNISSSAFDESSNLQQLYIPDSVTNIEDYVFDYCSGLTNITVDTANAVYSSDEYGTLFNKDKTVLIKYPVANKRNEYVIPHGVTTIKCGSFFLCENLSKISVPSTVTNIEDTAFYAWNITDVYYEGNENNWSTMTIGHSNETLTDATIHYNCKLWEKNEPTTTPPVDNEETPPTDNDNTSFFSTVLDFLYDSFITVMEVTAKVLEIIINAILTIANYN